MKKIYSLILILCLAGFKTWAQPTMSPSNGVASNITSNSLTLSWTNGNGNKRIVIGRAFGPSTEYLANWTDYSQVDPANTVFGSGKSFGQGYVIYVGTGNTINVTNLNPSTFYAFHIYEAADMGEAYMVNASYLTLNSTTSGSTPPPNLTPTVGATSLIFPVVTETGLTLAWSNGNGSKRIVIANQGSAVSTNPTNGISYTANTIFGEGSQIGTGTVVYNGTGSFVSVTGLTGGQTYYFTVIEYNEDIEGEVSYLYGTSSKTTGNATTTAAPSEGGDSDEDGIADSEDDYPNDAYKAFNNNYPAEGNGTLMFEDLWPSTGDYDFNDLVLDYNFNVITNASNQVVEAKYTFYTKAIGGGLHNGFAFQLDGIAASKIISVTGTKTTGISYTSMNSNGTEAGQTTANIVVIKNASELLPHSAGFAFVNVEADAPNVGMDTTVVTIKFAENGVFAVEETPISIADFSSTIFNPYLIVGQQRGKEIHLADRTPTALANQSYFGQQQDASNPSTTTYYKTASGLPWALNIGQSIPQATEKTDFTQVYLNFSNWATSGGNTNTDWYLDLAGYRNNTKIFSK